MTDFREHLKNAMHFMRIFIIFMIALVTWLTWHKWVVVITWLALGAALVLIEAIYYYAYERVRNWVIQREHHNGF